jgi:DNA repair exonuclease SbcCD ATPase subunit
MEHLLICRLSVLKFEINPSERIMKSKVKVFAGSNLIIKSFPFAEVFFFVFPWNSLELAFFLEQECLSRYSFQKVPENDEEILETLNISGIDLQGKIEIKVKFSVLPDFKVKKGIEPKNLQVFKETLNDVEELLREMQITKDFDGIDQENVVKGLDFDLLDSKTENDWEFCRTLLLGLNEKLKVLSGLDFLVKVSEDLQEKTLKSQETLHKAFQEKTSELKTLQSQQVALISQVHQDLTSNQAALNHSHEENRKLQTNITDLKGTVEVLQSEKSTLQVQLKNFDDQERMIRSLQEEITRLTSERELLRSDFSKAISDFQALTDLKDSEFSSISSENLQLKEQVKAHQSEIFSLQSLVANLEATVLSFNNEIKALTCQVLCLNDQESKATSMETLSKKHQSECMKQSENQQKTTFKFSEVVKTLNQEKMKFLKNISELQINFNRQEEKLKESEEKLLTKSSKLLEFKSKNTNLQEILNQSIDSQHISKSLLRLYSDYSKSKFQFSADSDFFWKVLINNAKEVLTLSRYLEQVRDLLVAKDEEKVILRDIITELQRRIPYFPVKDDEIDQAMAEYINSLQEPLDIPFVREDEGIYLFGTKKVFVKLDNGRLSSKS